MTLLIALLLMDHIGGFSSMAYFGVVLLWIVHLMVRHG
jgi:hypothetical protein